MTDLATRAPALLEAAVPDDRTVPDALIHLALQAIRHGAHQVSVVHESLDAYFDAPIGWILQITPVDHFVSGGDSVTELLSVRLGGSPDDLVAPAWLRQSAALGEGRAEVVEHLVELFEAALRNGWEVTYDRREFDNRMFQRVANRHGTIAPQPTHELRAQAMIWRPGAPADTVMPRAAVTMLLRLHSADEPLSYAKEAGIQVQIPAAGAEALLRRTAPGFARTARYDALIEDWVK